MSRSYETSLNHQCPTCRREFRTFDALKSHEASSHDRGKGHMMADCLECGETFHIKPNNEGAYCSTECSARAARRARYAADSDDSDGPEHAECKECGDTFVVKDNTRGVYCSRACAGNAPADRVTLECAGCGDPFEAKESVAETRQYCSLNCIYDNVYDDSERVEIQCRGCDDVFEIDRADGSEVRQYCDGVCALQNPPDIEASGWEADQTKVLATRAGSDIYHLPDLDADEPFESPMCGTSSNGFYVKDPTVYPSRELCLMCVAKTRHEHGPIGDDEPEQSDSIQQASEAISND